jgi:hypothetical protein
MRLFESLILEDKDLQRIGEKIVAAERITPEPEQSIPLPWKQTIIA